MLRLVTVFAAFVLVAFAVLTASQPVPTGLTGTWQLTFDEEFSGTELNRAVWYPQVTATSGFATGPTNAVCCYLDSPNNVQVSNGYLQISAQQSAVPFTCGNFQTSYSCGMVSTWSTWSQTYGAFEVRGMLPTIYAPGVQETFWLWPVNSLKYGAWPSSGEIDFAEFYSQYYYLVVPYIHYNNYWDTNVTAYNCYIKYGDFNVYTLLWTQTTLTILVNGKVCLTDTWNSLWPQASPQPFDSPFFIALTQALGVGGNAFQPGTTPLPATTLIDYVRVWQPTSATYGVATSVGAGSSSSGLPPLPTNFETATYSSPIDVISTPNICVDCLKGPAPSGASSSSLPCGASKAVENVCTKVLGGQFSVQTDSAQVCCALNAPVSNFKGKSFKSKGSKSCDVKRVRKLRSLCQSLNGVSSCSQVDGKGEYVCTL